MAELIIIAAIVAVCVIAVVMYVRKLRQGCCGASSDKESVIVPADENLSAYILKYTIDVGGMTCPKCAQRIQNAFNRQEGILAHVSHKENTAEVFTKKEMPEVLLRKTIADLGYSAGNIRCQQLDK